jgi:hypothetical protein
MHPHAESPKDGPNEGQPEPAEKDRSQSQLEFFRAELSGAYPPPHDGNNMHASNAVDSKLLGLSFTDYAYPRIWEGAS